MKKYNNISNNTPWVFYGVVLSKVKLSCIVIVCLYRLPILHNQCLYDLQKFTRTSKLVYHGTRLSTCVVLLLTVFISLSKALMLFVFVSQILYLLVFLSLVSRPAPFVPSIYGENCALTLYRYVMWHYHSLELSTRYMYMHADKPWCCLTGYVKTL